MRQQDHAMKPYIRGLMDDMRFLAVFSRHNEFYYFFSEFLLIWHLNPCHIDSPHKNIVDQHLYGTRVYPPAVKERHHCSRIGIP